MIRRLIASLAVTLLCLVALPASAAAWNPFQTVCSGSSAASNSAVCTDSNSTSDPVTGAHGVIMAVVNILAFVAGVTAVIMMIVAGFKYLTADGDSNDISAAKKTIIYALVGIVVIVASRSLIAFAVSKL